MHSAWKAALHPLSVTVLGCQCNSSYESSKMMYDRSLAASTRHLFYWLIYAFVCSSEKVLDRVCFNTICLTPLLSVMCLSHAFAYFLRCCKAFFFFFFLLLIFSLFPWELIACQQTSWSRGRYSMWSIMLLVLLHSGKGVFLPLCHWFKSQGVSWRICQAAYFLVLCIESFCLAKVHH